MANSFWLPARLMAICKASLGVNVINILFRYKHINILARAKLCRYPKNFC
jgi:hypothetical protein